MKILTITDGSGNMATGFSGGSENSTSVSELPSITCRANYALINGICHPICHLWEQNPHIQSVTLRAIAIAAITVGFVFGVAVIIISFIRYKRM